MLVPLLLRSGATAATHSGSFHADDVFSAAALRLVNPDLPVLRTRDPAHIDAAAIVFDVGRVFDPARGRFDHHQPEYCEARANGMPFSSFGLIWRELGAHLCASDAAAARVDRWLVEGIDAMDCGVTVHKEPAAITVMSISDAIASFNPGWCDDTSPAARANAFADAVAWATPLLRNTIRDAVQAEQASAAVAQGHLLEDDRILLLESEAPWKETLLGSPRYRNTLYVVSPDSQAKWHVTCVPDYLGSFANRKSLPAAWAGRDGAELDAVTGIEGGIFCHRGRFVAGHKTREGALAMARLALHT